MRGGIGIGGELDEVVGEGVIVGSRLVCRRMWVGVGGGPFDVGVAMAVDV